MDSPQKKFEQSHIVDQDREGDILASTASQTSSKDLDDSYGLYSKYRQDDIGAGEAKRVLRKIDWRVMPILFGTYLLQYLDKNSINFASVYGLQKGTHLHGQQYSWLGTHNGRIWNGRV